MALLDTGATHSCVANSFLKQLGVRYKVLNKDAQVSLIDANGKPLGVIGTVELPIGVGDVTLTHTFYVVRGLYLKALLGFDFFRENAAQIDIPNRTVFFNGQTAATTLSRDMTPRSRCMIRSLFRHFPRPICH
jgi:predicted aspartyl protease